MARYSFSEIIEQIRENNPDLPFERLGKDGLQLAHTRTAGGAPRLARCTLSGRPEPVETVNHGPGFEVTLKLVVRLGSDRLSDRLNQLTIGPIQPSGEASLLAAYGLGWRDRHFSDEEMLEQRTEAMHAITLTGRVPFRFMVGSLARFQVQLFSLAGSMAIFFTDIDMGEAPVLFDREHGDSDAPSDIPPPLLYGEEFELDDRSPIVYLVSDFHLGSDRYENGESNDMDWQILERFLTFLEAADADARVREVPYYDVVMNGDFLDLWQAKRSSNDTYKGRLDDIIATNWKFLSRLGRFLRGTDKCRFYYVIGNHDDPLLSASSPDDPVFGSGEAYFTLRSRLDRVLRSVLDNRILDGEIGRLWEWRKMVDAIPFVMHESYANYRLKVYAIHGHQWDDVNRRYDDFEPPDGQEIAEKINELQKTHDSLRHIEYIPMQATVSYIQCLLGDSGTPEDVRTDLEALRETLVDAQGLGAELFDVVASGMVDDAIQERTMENEVREETRKQAEDELDDLKRRTPLRILVTGHTHTEDLNPNRGGPVGQIYANTGSWFRRVDFSSGGGDCSLSVLPSAMPFVRVSKVKDREEAVVELNYYGTPPRDRTGPDGEPVAPAAVRVKLD